MKKLTASLFAISSLLISSPSFSNDDQAAFNLFIHNNGVESYEKSISEDIEKKVKLKLVGKYLPEGNTPISQLEFPIVIDNTGLSCLDLKRSSTSAFLRSTYEGANGRMADAVGGYIIMTSIVLSTLHYGCDMKPIPDFIKEGDPLAAKMVKKYKTK